MKIQSTRRSRGFTLVELLVVMAIIATLASVGFTVGQRALEKGKKLKTLQGATSISGAVEQFYAEYGALPKRDMTADEKVATSKGSSSFDPEFLNVLLGVEDGETPLNKRGNRFLTVSEGKGNKDGIIYTDASAKKASAMYDSWGGPFLVAMDGDYDDAVQLKTAAGKPVTLRGKRVAVWSNGADNVKDAAGKGKIADDVTTWGK